MASHPFARVLPVSGGEGVATRGGPSLSQRGAGWLVPLLLLSLACGHGSDPGRANAARSSGPSTTPAAESAEPAEGAEPGRAGTHAALGSSRASILAALRARRFDELENLLSELADKAAADPAGHEMEADNAFNAFSTAAPELEPLLDDWVSAERGSAVPVVARASYLAARGWQERGKKWAEDTPDASFVEMRRWTDRASIDAWAAVRERPRLINGWALLVNLANGKPSECVRIARQGLDEVPASFRIRAALMNCLRPRWGGSYGAMRAMARDAQSEAGRNPNLRWLLGYESEDRAGMALYRDDLAAAARWAAQALEEGGGHWRFLLTRAQVRSAQGQATEALADLDRALARWPEVAELLEQRISLLTRLGREEEAKAAVAQLETIDPASTYLVRVRTRLARGAAKACEALTRNDSYREALARCAEALAANPADAESSYWLGRAHLKLGDSMQALAAFESALAANPRHREAILNLDYLYAKRQEWDHIVALWDAYLVLEPGDARALLERAGTHHHRGDPAAACRDLRRACELGSSEACQTARQHC